MGSGTTRDAVSGWLKRHPGIRKAIRFFPSLAKRARTEPGIDYPTHLSVHGANNTTIDFVSSTSVRCIAEIGIYEGDTSVHFADHLGEKGQLHLYDFEERVDAVADRLAARGFDGVVKHGTTHKTFDSYNWSLMQTLEEHEEPIFDYVFLDGAHTWHHDALAFLLVDRLLVPGGYVDFDDYEWTLAGSPSLNPLAFPRTKDDYTAEQIDARQVELIVDLLVRRDDRYTEIVPNKIFQKRLT